MQHFALPILVLLHGQAGVWDEAVYVVAGGVGLVIFLLMIIARKKDI